MTLESWLTLIQHFRAIAVIRSSEFLLAQQMAKAVASGGMGLIEITWNSDRPAELIQHLRALLPDCTIGAGTLLSREQVKEAVAAGAEFLFTPHVDPDLIQLARDLEVPIVAGALSPTEIVQAWQAGATSVKVFPVQAVGGAEYIRSLKEPLHHIPLIPTGGVTVENAQAFLAAGAIGVGLAGSLFPKHLVNQGNWGAIAQAATALLRNLGVKSALDSKRRF